MPITMARHKKKTGSSDRHDPTKTQITLRIRGDMGDQLRAFVRYTGTAVNSEIVTAIRERLERNGFWPPPTQSGD